MYTRDNLIPTANIVVQRSIHIHHFHDIKVNLIFEKESSIQLYNSVEFDLGKKSKHDEMGIVMNFVVR